LAIPIPGRRGDGLRTGTGRLEAVDYFAAMPTVKDANALRHQRQDIASAF
jgi:hypothetical protein